MVKDDRTFGDKVSDSIAEFGGSWSFIGLAVFIIIAWVSLNIFSLWFDPFPFIFLNLLLSCVAAFQAPFIMMSQNRTEKKQDEAYRLLFAEIKTLVQQNLKIEKKILKVLEEKEINSQDQQGKHKAK